MGVGQEGVGNPRWAHIERAMWGGVSGGGGRGCPAGPMGRRSGVGGGEGAQEGLTVSTNVQSCVVNTDLWKRRGELGELGER